MHSPFFHQDSGCVRFWVPIAGIAVGATIGREALQQRCPPGPAGDDPLAMFRSRQGELEEAVRRRVAKGAVEPVMIRDSDLAPDPAASLVNGRSGPDAEPLCDSAHTDGGDE